MTRQLSLAVALCTLLLAACGKSEAPAAAPAPAATPAPAAAPAPAAPVAVNEAGKSAFGKACALCHAAGVAGAPKPGDKAEWAPRIAQGNDTLYKHAIEGFTGAKGAMPPKGGSALPDNDVKAAVDYMVGLSK
ncbi:c-type cytochrome [Aquabacterium humicola]|uniref:c-type cytochrome n=1 Tax=Aquabacterium humicola TaxID=3237377 RepID=UPI00254380D7|nr:c-type cytochrome [Rubrivivax pictus]